MMVGFFRKRHFLNPFDSPTGFTRLTFGQSLIPPSLPWFNLLATDSSEKYSLARLDHQTERYSVQMRSACFCCLWLLCTSSQWAGIVWGESNDVSFRDDLYQYHLTFEETQLLQSFPAESYRLIPKPKNWFLSKLVFILTTLWCWPLCETLCGPLDVEPYMVPWVGPNVGPSVRPDVGPSVRPNVGPCVGPCVGPYVGPSVRPYVGPCVGPYVVPYVRPYVRPWVGPCVGPYVVPYVRLYVRPYLRPWVGGNRWVGVVSRPPAPAFLHLRSSKGHAVPSPHNMALGFYFCQYLNINI